MGRDWYRQIASDHPTHVKAFAREQAAMGLAFLTGADQRCVYIALHGDSTWVGVG